MYKTGHFYACFEVVKIDLELRLVMFKKKSHDHTKGITA